MTTLATTTEISLVRLMAEMRSSDVRNAHRAVEGLSRELYRILSRSKIARQYTLPCVEDAFQETMIAVWDQKSLFRGESAVLSWVFSIFSNKLIDKARKDKLEKTDLLNDDEWKALDIVDESACDADMPTVLARQQVCAFLHVCIKHLSAKYPAQAVVMQHYQRGLSVDEIALIEGRPTGTIKSWASEAYKKLLNCLQQHGATGVHG